MQQQLLTEWSLELLAVPPSLFFAWQLPAILALALPDRPLELGHKGAPTPTRAVCIWVLRDREGRANELLLKVNGGTLEELVG